MKINILSFFFIIIFSGIVINVNAQCPPEITADGQTDTLTICPGNTVTIESSSASSYQWYHEGDEIIDSISQTITVIDAGEYWVSVNGDGCLITSDTITIAWFALPIANITFSDSPVCSGNTVTTTLEGDLGIDWFWREPTSGSETNPIVGAYLTNTLFSALITSADLCPTLVTNLLSDNLLIQE